MAQISKYDSFFRFVEEARANTGHFPTYPAITAALGLSPRTIAKYFRLLRQESLLPIAPNRAGDQNPLPPSPRPVAVTPPAATDNLQPPSPTPPRLKSHPSPPGPEPDLVAGLRQELRSLSRDNARLEQLLAAANSRSLEQERTIAKLEATLATQQERYNELVTAGKNEIKNLFEAMLKRDG